MVISEIKRRVRNILKGAGIEEYIFETDCILCDILGMSKSKLIVSANENIPDDISSRIISAADKRSTGYPLQYILGKWEFYGLNFKVGEGVLIPRPDTEILADTILEILKDKKSPKIIDLCSGSGCIAVSLAKNLGNADVTAAELSDDALFYLNENVRSNDADVKIVKGDIISEEFVNSFDNVKFDCIVSNPPYLTDDEMDDLMTEVTHEPESALRGGSDGLIFYRKITEMWKKHLADGGFMAFEIGYRQGEDVFKIMENAGFHDIFIRKDLGGNDRVVCGRS